MRTVPRGVARRLPIVVAVLSVAIVAAGCGDDDGGGGDDAAGGDSNEFCQLVEAAASGDPALDPTTEEGIAGIREYYQQVAEAAPDEIRDDVDAVLQTVESLGERSFTPSAGEAFSEIQPSLDRITAYVNDECGLAASGTSGQTGP